MKTYQINIRPTAELDIRNRYEHIYSESPENAKHWYKDHTSAIRALEHLALRGPIAEEDTEFRLGIRHLVVGRYRIIYLTTDNSVEILHVRHSRHTRRL